MKYNGQQPLYILTAILHLLTIGGTEKPRFDRLKFFC